MKSTREGSSVFSGALWLLSGSAAQSVLKAAVTAVLARLLSPEDFGLVAAAMAVITLVNMINGAGTGSFLVQKSEVTDDHFHTVFSYSILAGILSAGLVLLFRHWIAVFFNMPRLSTVITVLVFIFLFQALYRVSYTYLQRNMMFREMAGLDLLSYLVAYGVLGTGLAYAGYGVWALAMAAVAQSFFFAVLLFWRVPIKLKFLIKKDILKEATLTGSGFSAINILGYVARQGDYWVVGNMLGAAALGYYSRAFNLMTAPHSILGSALNNVLFARFSRLQNENEKLRHALKQTIAMIFFLGTPLSVFFILFARELILLLLGPGWGYAVASLQILSAALIAKTSIGILTNYLLGRGLLKSGFKIYFLYSLLVVIGAATGGFFAQVNGVAAGVALALNITFGLVLLKACRLSQLPLSFLIKHIFINILLAAPLVLLYVLVETYMMQNAVHYVMQLVFGMSTLACSYLIFIRLGALRLLGPELGWFLNKLPAWVTNNKQISLNATNNELN